MDVQHNNPAVNVVIFKIILVGLPQLAYIFLFQERLEVSRTKNRRAHHNPERKREIFRLIAVMCLENP